MRNGDDKSERLASKVGGRAWTQSVPSAVADGYEVEALDLLVFLMLVVDPSATADGTDCVQVANLES